MSTVQATGPQQRPGGWRDRRHAEWAGQLTAPRVRVLAAAALGVLGLSGCQSIAVNANNVATVRVVNASATSSGFDLYANSTAIAYNLGFGYNTSAVALAPGTYTISANQPNTQTHLAVNSATLANTHEYTVLLGNSLASLQETILQDQTTAAPSGQISIRLIDQAMHVGGVDIYLIPSSSTLVKTSPLLTNVTFGINNIYIAVPAGTYSLAVLPTGTVPVSTTTTLYTGAQVGYVAGAVRTVVLIDTQLLSTSALGAVVLDDYDPAGSGS